MNEFAIELPALLSASLTLSVSAILAFVALRYLNPGGHRIHRIVWIAVLVNGIILTRVSIDLPILNEQQTEKISNFFKDTQPKNLEPVLSTTLSTLDTDIVDQGAVAKPKTEAIESEAIASTVLPAANSSYSQVATSNPVNILSLIWLTGCLAAITFLFVSYLRIMSMLKNANPVAMNFQEECEHLFVKAGLKNPLALLEHDRLGPALMLTPAGYRIVVPKPLWSELDLGQRQAILQHEIEHYRRGDILVSFFAFIVASLHWFNPLSWLAVARLNLAAEWACDEAAISNETQQCSFARALLSISTSDSYYLAGAYGIGSSDLKARVQRIFAGTKRTSAFGNIALSSLAIAIVLFGWINVRLIESNAFGATPVAIQLDEAELEKNIRQLASQLNIGNALNEKFKSLVMNQAGIIAVGNSVADIERGNAI